MIKTARKDQPSQLNGMNQNGRLGDMEISPSSSEGLFSFNSNIVPDNTTQELENIADFVSQNAIPLQLNSQQPQDGVLPELNHSMTLSSSDFLCSTDLEPIGINTNNFIPTTFDSWLTNENQNHAFSELVQSHDTSLVSFNKFGCSATNSSHDEDFTSVFDDQDAGLNKTPQNYPDIHERYNFRSYDIGSGKDTSICSYIPPLQSFTYNNGGVYSSMPTTNTPCIDTLLPSRADGAYPPGFYGNKNYPLSRCLNEVGSIPKIHDISNTPYAPRVENVLNEDIHCGRVNKSQNGTGQKGYLSSSSDSRTTSRDTDANETSPNVTSDEAEDKTILSTNPEGVRAASKKTLYNEKWGVKVLKAWCAQHNISTTFCDITAEDLNELLINFWQTIQKASGGKYGRNSLFNLRAMINKYLKSKPRCLPFDIVTDNRFRSSNECLERELQVLARTGRKIDHKIPISLEHMWKLYESGALGLDSAESLMRKVWFEVTLHFNRRGATPQDKLRRNSFKISRDKNGRFLERAVSMETDSRQTPDRMYETGGRLCPILSYERYLEKLHPQQQRLFQQPRKKAQKQGEVWFGKAPIGEKALQSMMGTISMAANLPIKYTNHCVRTTPAAQLQEMMERLASGLEATRLDKKSVDGSNGFFCSLSNPPLVSNPNQQASLYNQKYTQQQRVPQNVPPMSEYYPNSMNRTWPASSAIQPEEQSYYMGLQRYFEPIGQDERANSSQQTDSGLSVRNYATAMPTPPAAPMNDSYNGCNWSTEHPQPLSCEQDGNHFTTYSQHQKYTQETEMKQENGYLDINGMSSPLSNAPVLNQIVASQDFLKQGMIGGEYVSRENSFAENNGFKLSSFGPSSVVTEYTQSIDTNPKNTSLKKLNTKLLGVST